MGTNFLKPLKMSIPRNPGVPLDLGWIESVQVNRPALERRAATHCTRRSVKKQTQLAWLLRVIQCIDLTALSGDDTAGNVTRLCRKAVHPLRPDYIERLGLKDRKVTVGAVCVYPNRVKDCVAALKGTNLNIASVAAGFPAGQTPMAQRLAEIEEAVKYGATEIDIVVTREHVINKNWSALYDETKLMREKCGEARLKVILAVGDLPTLRDVYKASLVTMMAGADFIKTSTGKEGINATMPVGILMARAVRDYHERTGHKVGFKPAGGIRSAKVATQWLAMIYEELGKEWCQPQLFRIGASSLLADVERQIEHGLSARYAAYYYQPMT